MITILFGLFMPAAGFAELSKDEALSQFVAAGMAYKEGRYDEAIERYRSITANNLVSGPLYYNLANSHFKKNNLGKAILNYERAKEYIPRDSDLKFNSEYAASQIDQYVEPSAGGIVQKAIQAHVHFYTYNEMTLIVFILLILIGAFHILSLYIRPTANITLATYSILTLFVIVFIVGIFAKHQTSFNMAITQNDTDTYFEPRTDSTAHFKLSEGMRARILKSQGSWLKVERADGKQGWVDKEFLEKI